MFLGFFTSWFFSENEIWPSPCTWWYLNLARLVGGDALAPGLGIDGVLVAGGLYEGDGVVHGVVASIEL